MTDVSLHDVPRAATAGSRQDDPAKAGSVGWLKALNFSIADVQNGMGPYMALFLQSSAQWNSTPAATSRR